MFAESCIFIYLSIYFVESRVLGSRYQINAVTVSSSCHTGSLTFPTRRERKPGLLLLAEESASKPNKGGWLSEMADALATVPDVEIDPEGTFKYILVRVKVKDGSLSKDIVRGTKSAQYHSKSRTYEANRFRLILSLSLQRLYPIVVAQQCFVVFLSKSVILACS